jgi:uncharacterized protein YciI
MFLINSVYVKDQALAEPHQHSHVAWASKYIAAGVFLLAGPKRDQSGGLILARGVDRTGLLGILAEDSYLSEGIVAYDVTDFTPVLTRQELAMLKE